MRGTHIIRLLAGVALGMASLAASAAQTDDANLAQQGAYVAKAADCAACHTAAVKGGKPYAGGYAIQSPLGTIYATNITPSKQAGIGNWTEQDFARAVREGVAADGHHLYPAMPYADYSGMTDADVHALYVYFMTQVAPVDDAPKATTHLGFPYGIRASMAFWNLLYVDSPKPGFVPADTAAARGKYLVDVLGHCGSCHTPRNLLMATDKSSYLAGGDVGGWHAPNITSDPTAGIGGWSEDELAQFLKTGHAAGKAQAAGGMAEAVEHSLRFLSDSDLHAMASYLKGVPPKHDAGQDAPAYSYGGDAGSHYSFDDASSSRGLADARDATPTGAALLKSRTYTEIPKVEDGARLYADACASCHQPNGSGTDDHYYPSLTHNSAVGSANTSNLVMAILHGVDRRGADDKTHMPAFERDMTDAQVAAVASYVTHRFGNAQQINAADVATLRAGGPEPRLKALTPWLMIGGVVIVVLVLWLIVFLVRRRKRQHRH